MYDGSTALALNDEQLREIAGMASSEDAPQFQSLPVLKINYDADSIHKQGAWVVGQKKKEDVITEEGEAVKGLIILAVRNRYNYYVETDTTKNCCSPLHNMGDTVYGSNYKSKCGKGCAKRADGLDPRCQAQRVVFGIALTESNNMVECVLYIKGANYMPFSEYFENLTKVKVGSKHITVPSFFYLTTLNSVGKKNGSVKYWVGEYTKGPSFSIEQCRQFEEKRHQVQAYIDNLNANITGGTSGEPEKPKLSVVGGTAMGSAVRTVEPEIVDDIPDFGGAKTATVVEADDLPFDISTTSSTAPPDDIEAAIAKAMAGLK